MGGRRARTRPRLAAASLQSARRAPCVSAQTAGVADAGWMGLRLALLCAKGRRTGWLVLDRCECVRTPSFVDYLRGGCELGC